jgi:hypothetical protein
MKKLKSFVYFFLLPITLLGIVGMSFYWWQQRNQEKCHNWNQKENDNNPNETANTTETTNFPLSSPASPTIQRTPETRFSDNSPYYPTNSYAQSSIATTNPNNSSNENDLVKKIQESISEANQKSLKNLAIIAPNSISEKSAKEIIIGACKKIKECPNLRSIVFIDNGEKHYIINLVELWKKPLPELPNLAWDEYQAGDNSFDILLFRNFSGKNDNITVSAKIGNINNEKSLVDAIINGDGALEL